MTYVTPRTLRNINIGAIFVCLAVSILNVIQFYEKSGKHDIDQIFLLRTRIAELESIIHSKSKVKHHAMWVSREIPSVRDLGRELDVASAGKRMADIVTVIMFSRSEEKHCLRSRIENVQREYPNIKLIVASTAKYKIAISKHMEFLPNVEKEGKALATMVSKVKTPYFLYLSSSVQLPPNISGISVTWLLHALEKIPELDFIGGSFLRHDAGVRYPVLEVPCHRLRMCNWTMSQTFEYRYSVDDMMVCEETSSSFMGRMESLGKVEQFDPNLDAMATTDFFLRAKGKAVTGLRPEVQFIVSKICFPSPLTVSEEADMKFAFMKKHQIFIVRDSFNKEVKAVDSKHYGSSQNYGIVFWKDGTYASPMYARGLLFNLELAADFFESKNISYFLGTSTLLGGIKTRGLLPWDIHVDLGFFAGWQEVYRGLKMYCEARNITARLDTRDYIKENKQLLLRAAGDFGFIEMFPQTKSAQDDDVIMYMYIHGRVYPVKRYVFNTVRRIYGNNYLQMRQRLSCRIKGHHACVPEQFQYGGGHWREHYCEI